VSAYNSYGESSQSSYASATTSGTAPSAPSSVSATAASSGSITVSWGSVSGASGYYVYHSTSSGGTYSYVDSTSSTSYTDTGLSSNTTYYYKVSAYNYYGEGSLSSYASATTSGTTPSAPSSVSASAQSASSITVSWGSVSGASGYYVYRATSSGGTYSLVDSTSSTSYTDTGLSSDTIYYYKVSAYNGNGEGSMSDSYGYAATSSSSSSYTNINDNYWYTYYLLAGEYQYYRIYVTAGYAYVIVWEDFDIDSSLCDIKVSASWQSSGAEIFSATDGTEGSTYFYKSFTASSSGYVILKVQGYSTTSSGTYHIAYY
jgi:uncharacterized protein YxeA